MNESNLIKIAIHHSPGSFSDRWIEYCEEKHITYSLVNCYDNKNNWLTLTKDTFMWPLDVNKSTKIFFLQLTK